jgi:hypothetical protein
MKRTGFAPQELDYPDSMAAHSVAKRDKQFHTCILEENETRRIVAS